MKVVYAKQKIPEKLGPSIFLAGPTPRSSNPVPSWRPEALKILEKIEFPGTVFVPEDEGGTFRGSYTDQTEWEKAALNIANITVFWIPRELETMPAFTTNVEFGYWVARQPDKIVYGRPEQAPKTKYLDWLISSEVNEYNIRSSLKETIKDAAMKSWVKEDINGLYLEWFLAL
jgi:hypothetical protein